MRRWALHLVLIKHAHILFGLIKLLHHSFHVPGIPKQPELMDPFCIQTKIIDENVFIRIVFSFFFCFCQIRYRFFLHWFCITKKILNDSLFHIMQWIISRAKIYSAGYVFNWKRAAGTKSQGGVKYHISIQTFSISNARFLSFKYPSVKNKYETEKGLILVTIRP